MKVAHPSRAVMQGMAAIDAGHKRSNALVTAFTNDAGKETHAVTIVPGDGILARLDRSQLATPLLPETVTLEHNWMLHIAPTQLLVPDVVAHGSFYGADHVMAGTDGTIIIHPATTDHEFTQVSARGVKPGKRIRATQVATTEEIENLEPGETLSEAVVEVTPSFALAVSERATNRSRRLAGPTRRYIVYVAHEGENQGIVIVEGRNARFFPFYAAPEYEEVEEAPVTLPTPEQV